MKENHFSPGDPVQFVSMNDAKVTFRGFFVNKGRHGYAIVTDSTGRKPRFVKAKRLRPSYHGDRQVAHG